MTQKKDMHTSIRFISQKKNKFTLEAYQFVLETLEFALKKCKKPRHISAQELLEGMRVYAIHQFGPMAKTVLAHFGIHSCRDFGEIVFILISHGLIRKSEQDSLEDFENGFSFKEAFEDSYIY